MNGQHRIEPDMVPELDMKVDPPPRKRVRLIPMLPSLLTLANLFCGFLAISYASDAVLLAKGDPAAAVDRIALAGWIVFLAMVFDALDGRVARITGQVSEFGAALDSLSDIVSFGVAPAFMTKALAEQLLGLSNHRVTLGFCVFFVLCAALRLARHHAEEDPQEDGQLYFLGLPSPGAAGLVVGIALFYARFYEWAGSRYVIAALPFLVPLLGILMISRVPYPHIPNRFLRGAKPMKYLVFLAFIVAVAIVLQSVEAVLAGGLLFYALMGPAVIVTRLVTGRAAKEELDLFD